MYGPRHCTLSPTREGRERKVTVFVSSGRNSHVSDFTGEVGRQGGRPRPVQCSALFPGLPQSWEGKAEPHFPYGQACAHLNFPERIPATPQRLHCADQLDTGMQMPLHLGVYQLTLWTAETPFWRFGAPKEAFIFSCPLRYGSRWTPLN